MKPITTGILQNEIRHLTSDGDAALERHKEWGYYTLAGAVSTATNPHNGDFRPFCVFYAPFRLEQSFERGEGKGKDERWIARAFIALMNQWDAEVGEFFVEEYNPRTVPPHTPVTFTREYPNGRRECKTINTGSLGFATGLKILQRLA